ncbi:hypothetical protein [Thermaerobacter subterraneus]|uniref:hypothetical protein n=1 Tax=Thermaerobacter subterraneus TaxID=175696 RepID=UPI001FA78B31|nr:hypothetical protein [Thermaerobacter subterraneus]
MVCQLVKGILAEVPGSRMDLGQPAAGLLPPPAALLAPGQGAALIALCYGGGFGTMPSWSADYFGPRYAGSIYGIMLLAWGLRAIPSPLMIARVRELTGTYTTALYVIAVAMLVALVLPLVARPPVAGARRAATGTAQAAGS